MRSLNCGQLKMSKNLFYQLQISGETRMLTRETSIIISRDTGKEDLVYESVNIIQ